MLLRVYCSFFFPINHPFVDHVFVVAVGNGAVQTSGAVNSLSAGLGYKCMYVAGSITYNIYTTFERGKKVGWPSCCIRGRWYHRMRRGVLFAFTHRKSFGTLQRHLKGV